MLNTSGLSPLQSTPPTKSCIEDFPTLEALYADIAAHLFFSPAAAQSVKGDKGETGEGGDPGTQGEQGIQGEKGDDGDSAYEVWLSTQTDQTQNEKEFIEAITGPAGPGPTASLLSRVSISAGATFADIQGTVGLNFFVIEYNDGLGNPVASVVPAGAFGIKAVTDLNNGFTRVHFAGPAPDANFKLVSSKFES